MIDPEYSDKREVASMQSQEECVCQCPASTDTVGHLYTEPVLFQDCGLVLLLSSEGLLHRLLIIPEIVGDLRRCRSCCHCEVSIPGARRPRRRLSMLHPLCSCLRWSQVPRTILPTEVAVEWRIFFIGPMPSGDSSHFDKMVAAVVNQLQKKGYQVPENAEYRLSGGTAVGSLVLTRGANEVDEVTLVKPHDLFSSSSISNNVFDAIDDCDLIIADLTDVRPAVIYEVAFAHALGIWTILLSSDADNSSARPPRRTWSSRARRRGPSAADSNPEFESMFYLRPYRHAAVNFALEDILSQEFKNALDTWLDERNKRFDSSNPFTDFYGAPIPDISAASGLANGYHENFLRRVLAPNSRLVDLSDGSESKGRPISGVLVVKPENLQSLPNLIKFTANVVRGNFDEGVQVAEGESAEVYVDTKGFGKRTCMFVVDSWLIDVPRTAFTLERSPRLKRVASRSGSTTVAAADQPAPDHLTSVLISRFFEVLKAALKSDSGNIEGIRDRFFYGSPEEIVRFLQLPPNQRPTVWD